jgi:hypothetical protein
MTTTDPEEACNGEGARMLPCGHIFGRKCLANMFKIVGEVPGRNRCPACRREYRVALNAAFITAFILGVRGGDIINLWTRRTTGNNPATPVNMCNSNSMDIGVKVNVFRTIGSRLRLER